MSLRQVRVARLGTDWSNQMLELTGAWPCLIYRSCKSVETQSGKGQDKADLMLVAELLRLFV